MVAWTSDSKPFKGLVDLIQTTPKPTTTLATSPPTAHRAAPTPSPAPADPSKIGSTARSTPGTYSPSRSPWPSIASRHFRLCQAAVCLCLPSVCSSCPYYWRSSTFLCQIRWSLTPWTWQTSTSKSRNRSTSPRNTWTWCSRSAPLTRGSLMRLPWMGRLIRLSSRKNYANTSAPNTCK